MIISGQGSFLNLSGARAIAINPVAGLNTDNLSHLLREISRNPDLSEKEIIAMDEQISALVPALIELRDNGYIDLSMSNISEKATLLGFIELSLDIRVSEESRKACSEIASKYKSSNFHVINKFIDNIMENNETSAKILVGSR